MSNNGNDEMGDKLRALKATEAGRARLEKMERIIFPNGSARAISSEEFPRPASPDEQAKFEEADRLRRAAPR